MRRGHGERVSSDTACRVGLLQTRPTVIHNKNKHTPYSSRRAHLTVYGSAVGFQVFNLHAQNNQIETTLWAAMDNVVQ